VVHLPTRAIERFVDDIFALPANPEVENRIAEELSRRVASFRTWDEETRQAFLIDLVTKEETTRARDFFEYRDRTEAKALFPLGTNLTAHFLRGLSSIEQEKMFLNTLHAVSEHVDFTDKDDRAPRVIDTLAIQGRFLFDFRWNDIRKKALDTLGHDPTISTDGRWQAIEAMLRSFRMSNSWSNIDGALNAGKDIPRDPETLDLLALQDRIGRITLDPIAGEGLRGAILQYLSFSACSPELKKGLEGLLTTQGTSARLSKDLLSWINFRAHERQDKGAEAYGVIQHVVRERIDAPAIQIRAMDDLLFEDLRPDKAGKERSWSDPVDFIQRAQDIFAAHPEGVDGAEGFLTLIGSFDEGAPYVKSLFADENLFYRANAIRGALYRNPHLIEPEAAKKTLADCVATLEKGGTGRFLREFVEAVTLRNTEIFTSADVFLLSRLRSVIERNANKEYEGDSEILLTRINGLVKQLNG
jgi:hypothetical protein